MKWRLMPSQLEKKLQMCRSSILADVIDDVPHQLLLKSISLAIVQAGDVPNHRN